MIEWLWLLNTEGYTVIVIFVLYVSLYFDRAKKTTMHKGNAAGKDWQTGRRNPDLMSNMFIETEIKLKTQPHIYASGQRDVAGRDVQIRVLFWMWGI